MAKDLWEPCPRCGSKSVEARGRFFWFMLGGGCVSFGLILIFIPFIGIPLIAFGIVSIATGFIAKGVFECKDCRNVWRSSKLNSEKM